MNFWAYRGREIIISFCESLMQLQHNNLFKHARSLALN